MSRLQFEITRRRERLLIDGNHAGGGYNLDYLALARSALADGDYYFFTCGCGNPGCAGIFEPTCVTSDADKIYWHMIEPEPESWYSFRRAHYLESIREAMDIFLRLYSGKNANRRFGRVCYLDRRKFEEVYALLAAAGNGNPETK